MNAYFGYANLTPFTTAKAADVNSRFNGVVAGFDRLPHYDKINQDSVTYVVAGGTANAITVSLPTPIIAYTAGLSLKIKLLLSNGGPTTINVDGLGPKEVKRDDGSQLQAGDLLSGGVVLFVYDGIDFRQMRPSAIATSVPPAAILAGLVTVDGAGSGLDADMVDGRHVGTSGDAVPSLAGANTFSAPQVISGPTSAEANLSMQYTGAPSTGASARLEAYTTSLLNAANQRLGALQFAANDTSGNRNVAASIIAKSLGAWTATDNATLIQFNCVPFGALVATEAARLTSAGLSVNGGTLTLDAPAGGSSIINFAWAGVQKYAAYCWSGDGNITHDLEDNAKAYVFRLGPAGNRTTRLSVNNTGANVYGTFGTTDTITVNHPTGGAVLLQRNGVTGMLMQAAPNGSEYINCTGPNGVLNFNVGGQQILALGSTFSSLAGNSLVNGSILQKQGGTGAFRVETVVTTAPPNYTNPSVGVEIGCQAALGFLSCVNRPAGTNAQFQLAGAPVQLVHAGTIRLATSATGVDITGTFGGTVGSSGFSFTPITTANPGFLNIATPCADPGVQPAIVNIANSGGLGGGSAVTQYGIKCVLTYSANGATDAVGVYGCANQGVGGMAYGVIGQTAVAGNSTTPRTGVFGIAAYNADAANLCARGVHGDVNCVTGSANNSISYGGSFVNSSARGTAFGLYCNAVAAPGGAASFRADFNGVMALQVQQDNTVVVTSPTTASAANVHIPASPGNILRSTSALRYKREVAEIPVVAAHKLRGVRPIQFKSKSEYDDPDTVFYGFIAEEVAEAGLDPLVAYAYQEDQMEYLVEVDQPAIANEPAWQSGRMVPKAGEQKRPDGVQYERVVVLQQLLINELYERLEALEGKVA